MNNTRTSLSASTVGTAIVALVSPELVHAHVSEQGLVLLLPTAVYITSGVLAVVLTILLLAFMPVRWTHALFPQAKTTLNLNQTTGNSPLKNNATTANSLPGAISSSTEVSSFNGVEIALSLLSTIFLLALLWTGLTGSHDPLENPLPLFIWTIWWIGFVVLQGVFGNLWRFVNPWTGVYHLVQALLPTRRSLRIPDRMGVWPGVIALLLVMTFALADVAPDAPGRLSLIVALYWLFTLIGLIVFGEQWLRRCECFSMLLFRYAQLSAVGKRAGKLRIGFPGWPAFVARATTISGAVFILVLLGTGSFDGLNETFSWLAFIGVNPLEFPGRSAIIDKTVLGLLAANALLISVYAACVWAGTHWANQHVGSGTTVPFHSAFCQLAISMLPIAFVYHFAHFLTAFMVNAQYALAAASDPFDKGADLLNLGTFYVTTGFMNSHHSVEAIWLTQATAVVVGHVLSVILAHAIALDLFGSARRAIISQAPLAAFMVVYTFIGLWLLAAPRGA